MLLKTPQRARGHISCAVLGSSKTRPISSLMRSPGSVHTALRLDSNCCGYFLLSLSSPSKAPGSSSNTVPQIRASHASHSSCLHGRMGRGCGEANCGEPEALGRAQGREQRGLRSMSALGQAGFDHQE
ncbi:hypothetical protein HJG60_010994 [Phyllostomus discolor]|uniref:Uncharacterized protein n=1 Tax=Phyllostomus discolor TaxID=89673 RepID=A0A834EAK3_9CHIR|nr:hypothetical protein HJG60_010994 [Phyllostomus discolor]